MKKISIWVDKWAGQEGYSLKAKKWSPLPPSSQLNQYSPLKSV
jgi:hypothetical protein